MLIVCAFIKQSEVVYCDIIILNLQQFRKYVLLNKRV